MKLAVITGCDSGIGRSLALVFAENGYSVIISFLENNPFEGDGRIIARKLDLRDEKQVGAFASFVNRHCSEGHSLEYLVNNAGVAMGGPFENIPFDIYRTVMEINFFGLVSLTQKIIPCLIRCRGRLVVNGSMAGRIALPFLSPYTASKFALEGWCDSVRRELNPLGVSTILLETAGIATPIWNKGLRQDYSFADRKYETSIRKFKETFIAGGNSGMDADRAAARMFRFITRKKPKARYIVAQNRLLSFIELLIPGRVLDSLVARMFSMRYGG